MSAFREQVAAMDALLFDELADDVLLSGLPAKAMFSSPWLAPQMGGNKTGIVEPIARMRDHDVGAVVHGVTLEHAGRRYIVVSIEPDGSGMTDLILRPNV